MSSLDAYYKKWEAVAKDLDAPEPRPVTAMLGDGTLSDIDPKQISVEFGKPLSEEEFHEYQKRKGIQARVVGTQKKNLP